MMDLITAVLSNHIIAFIIVVGVVVFVHELGHFLAAVAVGVRVEEFSIGMGPKAIGFRYRDVEYKICWLPLGGYVRLFGAEPGSSVSLEQREESITTARLWKRALVAISGPLGNLILTYVVMVGVANWGVPYPAAVVAVMPDSVAWNGGMRDGDRVVSINGVPVRTWSDLERRISRSPDERLLFEVQRGEETLTLPITPAVHESESQFGEDIRVGRVGITFVLQTPRVVVPASGPLAEAGFRTGDRVVSIDGKEIKFFHEIDNTIFGVGEHDKPFNFVIKRPTGDATAAKDVADEGVSDLTIQISPRAIPSDAILASTDLTIETFSEDAAPQKRQYDAAQAWKSCGVTPKTTLLAVEEYGPIHSRVQLSDWKLRVERQFGESGLPIDNLFPVRMSLLSPDGSVATVSCAIPLRTGRDNLNRKHVFFDLPFRFVTNGVFAPPAIVKSESFFASLVDGMDKTLELSGAIIEAVGKLVTGRISVANLGGPIEIARVAGDVAQGGLLSFVQMIGVISINLGLINLFPLPILDGGALVLIGLEAAYGRTLPPRVHQIVFQVGIFLMVLLMLTVFYNDILRLFQG